MTKRSGLLSSLSVSLSLSLCAQAQPTTGGPPLEEPFQVTQRGADHRVWSKVSWITNRLGELEARTNSYTELTTGLHFRNPVSGEWVESDPSFDLTPEGYAVVRRCQHRVIISPNLNAPDGIVVDLQTVDGQRLRSGIAGLNLFDPVSGNSLQAASVRDVVGTQVSSNEIVWFDAFEGLRADVRVRNERGQFHQDVLLREKLSASQLTALGFDPNTVRLEVWTEFVEAPEPVAQRIVLKTETNAALRATMVDPDEVDYVLKFGNEMQIGPGSAFIEDEPTKATRVFKQWQETGGRRFLIEAVKYSQLLPLLEALPVKTAALETGEATSVLAANRLPPQRAKASAMAAANGTNATKTMIAKLDSTATQSSLPRVVLDYVVTLSSGANKTLQGDTTYYVSGTVSLSGTTTIEGGTVVKFAPSASAQIIIQSSLIKCLTGSYRPAIFTAKDDNSVGETVSGSSGTPSGYYGSGLKFEQTPAPLQYLRLSYGQTGITTGYGVVLNLAHAQFVNCKWPFYAEYESEIHARNALFCPADGAQADPAAVLIQGETFTFSGEHLTVHNCTTLATDWYHGNDSHVYLTNSLLVSVAQPGNVPQTRQNTEQPDPPVFATRGAGSHYLADDSSHRDAGTTAINWELATALKTKTTHRPPAPVQGPITSDDTWTAEAAWRDSDQPDLGYHYEPLDRVVNAVLVSAALRLQGGVVVGTYGSGSSFGLGITSTGSLVSEGSPANLNWIVRYNTLQEQVSTTWASSTVGSSVKIYSGTPNVTATYTGWSVPAALGDHFNNSVSSAVASSFTHCQFSGGKFTVDPGSVDMNNCLWQRVYVTLRDLDGDPEWRLYNNLFYGGTLYYRAAGDNPTMLAYDNFFDRTAITRGSASEYFTHDYNGYITGQNRLLPSPAPNDVEVSSMAYAPGPRGDFYQAQTDLKDQGSRTAVVAGLTEFTSLTDYQPDSGDVDIGFHYYRNYISSGPIDVAFIIDNTTSMGSAIDNLKQGIRIVLDDIAASSGYDYRMALVTTDTEQVNVRFPFSSDRAAFETALDSMPITDGLGDPESTDECLNTVVNALPAIGRINQDQCQQSPLQIGDFTPFRSVPNIRRFVVLVTDNPPGGFCDDNTEEVRLRALDYAQDAREATPCIKINSVLVKGAALEDKARSVMEGYTTRSCGWYSELPANGLGIDEAVAEMLYVPGACTCP